MASSTSIGNATEELNIRAINKSLVEMFQNYSMALDKIMGGSLFEYQAGQVVQTQDENGVSMQHGQGRIGIRNGIGKLEYLLDHRDIVGKAIGVEPDDIFKYRRDIGKMSEYISKMMSKFDIGDPSGNTQLYISRHDGNISSLDSTSDWVDYILTQSWVDRLAKQSASSSSSSTSTIPDYRIDTISNMVQEMMKDHEIDHHKTHEDFNPSLFMDKVEFNEDDGTKPVDWDNRFMDAMNKAVAMKRLDHGFYEFFKPLGGTTERYIKVKVSTKGELDISGVVSLDGDCELIEWEYGSPEYLRSLNTGNKRYRFKLSRPINDLSEENPSGSVMWWKPDEPEPLEDDEQEEEGGDSTESNLNDQSDNDVKLRYYKPYETERMLRWFGTTYIPLLDPDGLRKAVVCSAPRLSNDVQSSIFHKDATHIWQNMDMARARVDEATSLALLSMSAKSTMRVIQLEDGQYLEFIVAGGQQTSTLSFHVVGKMYDDVLDMNHFISTWNDLQKLRTHIYLQKILLDVVTALTPNVKTAWDAM